MTVRERILSIEVIEKAKENPKYAKKLGLKIKSKKNRKKTGLVPKTMFYNENKGEFKKGNMDNGQHGIIRQRHRGHEFRELY